MCIKITIELLNPTSRIVSVKNRVELLNHIQNIHIGYMSIKTGIELLKSFEPSVCVSK